MSRAHAPCRGLLSVALVLLCVFPSMLHAASAQIPIGDFVDPDLVDLDIYPTGTVPTIPGMTLTGNFSQLAAGTTWGPASDPGRQSLILRGGTITFDEPMLRVGFIFGGNTSNTVTFTTNNGAATTGSYTLTSVAGPPDGVNNWKFYGFEDPAGITSIVFSPETSTNWLYGIYDILTEGKGPTITSIADLPNDQGRQLRIQWDADSRDISASSLPITGYSIFRRIDVGFKTANVELGDLTPAAYPPGDWDFITTVPAFEEASYSAIVPTVADSTVSNGMHLSFFFVRAMTADPGAFFDSAPNSGYSLDNLAPGVPQQILAAYQSNGVDLNWDIALEPDFQYYRIYRGDTPGFVPSAQTLVQQTSDPSWTDPSPNPWGLSYKITAVDHAGNESEAGAPGVATGAPIASRNGYALHPASPNPFNPSTVLSFDLPKGDHVRLVVYDVAGRTIATLLNEHRGAGDHRISWHGVDDTGKSVASGVYIYRLESSSFTQARRMTLVK